MVSLLHLHIASLFIIYINFLIYSKNISDNLGSKYFLVNYIYHNHTQFRYFMIFYPFLIIFIYFLLGNIIPIGAFFLGVLHVYFMYELISRKNIEDKEEYIDWYTHNVEHGLSMHTHDMLRKNFNFLHEKVSRLVLFKFEIIFFVCLVIESEAFYEALAVLDKFK